MTHRHLRARSVCRTIALLVLSTLVVPVHAADASPARARGGELPTDAQGRRLNLDFETGTLADWRAEGDAFTGQPIEGDAVTARGRADMTSQHQGRFWIGTFERGQDAPQGTLTSVPFAVDKPFASFLVAGGSHQTTRVDLVRRDNNEVFFTISGRNRENLEPVIVDLKDVRGKSMFIRVVDEDSGPWGHINFDDFRFHDARPAIALARGHTGPAAPAHENAGLDPVAAARAMIVPEGFRVDLFAGEPDVQQPIAMAIDDRGRLWIAEAYSYPRHVTEDQARDRILIFEDRDGDGHFDSRKVFAEKLNLVSGLEVGFGGVWVGAAPNFLFIPDKDGDDVPDGPPQVLLDGFGFQDTHETLNSFIWGPDGWLYGCHGVFTHSRVGKPGTPDAERVPINAGIWRYQPLRHEFEVFAHGTSNPWGVDFNDRGQAFLTACVIPHLFHVIQGGRYHRQAGQHFNPYTYDDIKTIALHRHWVGNQWNNADRSASDNSGGGHAHAGAMVYLGGAWPEKYRDQLFMNNIHGARINQDQLAPRGSGYVGDRAPDFLQANDMWSQILYLTYGPDGNVFMIDWYDANQCHHGRDDGHDRSNGRVFKISYGQAKPVTVDLKKLSDLELAELQLHKNDWYVRHARRILQERASNGEGKIDPAARARLVEILKTHADETRRLRALWALHVTGLLSHEVLFAAALGDKSPYVRAWTIQLGCEQERPQEEDFVLNYFYRAGRPSTPVERLYLASAALRLPAFRAGGILEHLVSHAEDATDHNLPLMYWYALERYFTEEPFEAIDVAHRGKLPLLRALIVRRAAQSNDQDFTVGDRGPRWWMVDEIAETPDEWPALLAAANEGLAGFRQVAMPDNWSALYQKLSASSDANVRRQATTLALTFGDTRAIGEQLRVMDDPKAKTVERLSALLALTKIRAPGLAPSLQRLVAESDLCGNAIRALALYDDPHTPSVLLDIYPRLSQPQRVDALNTLASRPAYGTALLAAVEAKRVPSTDLSADVIRQLRNLKDAQVDAEIARVWGTARDTPADKAKQIVELTKMLQAKPKRENAPDAALGRAVFVKTCALCHTLFGAGGKVGPELTGSNRANLDYILSNIVDPSALIGKDYIAQVIITTDGRTLTGLVKQEDANSITLATANETVVINKREIDERMESTKSMMPEEILKPFGEREIRSLVAYLASATQVPVAATADNARSLFNERDLAGWTGNTALWSVENEELVGRTTGLKKNEFLVSDMQVANFKLAFEVLLVDNQGNSGVQFRSQALSNGDVQGYQADIGPGWWGKLYEEHGRALLWNKSGESHLRPGQWNQYEIKADGSKLETRINGQLCVDLDDPAGAKRGIIALQLHSGGPTEVRYRKFVLEVLPPTMEK
ncbi:MAG: DUF1080 domain-containing protein [Planctomycetes bacterium]|nr:DUF1080 domain-containing protein [Planctomycetota bacterium]